jgi:hypothetical protein
MRPALFAGLVAKPTERPKAFPPTSGKKKAGACKCPGGRFGTELLLGLESGNLFFSGYNPVAVGIHLVEP